MSLEQPSLVFPPAIGGVVLPRGDRAAARLGLTLYTASKGWVLAAQRISHALIGVVGPRALPGRRVTLRVAEWEELTASWHGVVGPVRSVAQYQRKDPRAGLLLLLMREHGLPLVVKVRERSDGVVQEQRVLDALQGHHPRGLHVPRPAGPEHQRGSHVGRPGVRLPTSRRPSWSSRTARQMPWPRPSPGPSSAWV